MSLKALLPVLLAVATMPAFAWDDCRARAQRHAEMDAAGIDRVEIIAGAGDLEVIGHTDASAVSARGKACARDEDELAQLELRIERDGSTLRVSSGIPRDLDHARLDFTVELPAALPVRITDSSGDVDVGQVAALDLRDSSGDVQIADVAGDLRLEDSSGDLRVARVGDVHVVSDSSGDIRIEHAHSVRIDADSSGRIYVRDVSGDVSIGDDASGDIVVRGVGGNFTVDNDGSGEIDYSEIAGQVRKPRGK
jgi:Toastrack DUF4097